MLTQSCDPISCCGKPVDRTNEIGLERTNEIGLEQTNEIGL